MGTMRIIGFRSTIAAHASSTGAETNTSRSPRRNTVGARSSSQRSPRQSSGLSRSPRNVPSERRTPRWCVAVPPLAKDVRVEHPVVERLGVRHGDLPHERPHLLPARPRQRRACPSARPASGSLATTPSTRSGVGTSRVTPSGAPTSTEPPDAPGLVEREDGAHEAADRAAREVDRVELEAVQDVAHEGRRNRREIRRLVVERIRQPVAGQVDGQHAVSARERRQDRRPEGGVVERAVDEHERRAVSELEHPGLALRPPQAARARARCAIRSSTASCAASILRSSPLVPRGRRRGRHRAPSAGTATPAACRFSMTTAIVLASSSVGLNSTISAPAWWTGVCPGGT